MSLKMAKIGDVISPVSGLENDLSEGQAKTYLAIRTQKIQIVKLHKPDKKTAHTSHLSGKVGKKTWFVEYVRCDDSGKPIADREHREISITDLIRYFGYTVTGIKLVGKRNIDL